VKPRTLTCITAMTLFAAAAVPVRLAAQQQQVHNNELRRYTITDVLRRQEDLLPPAA